MDDSNNKPDDRSGNLRSSGATKRIVVEDVAEKIPRAVGRRLETPQAPTAAGPRHLARPARRASGDTLNIKRVVMIGGSLLIVLIVVPVIAIMVRAVRTKGTTTKSQTQASVAAPEPVNTLAAPVATATPEQTPSPEVKIPADTDSSSAVEAEAVRLMALQLASQISQKSGYEFGPEFVELIRGLTREYSSEKALIGARQYRREINKSFRDEGLNPLFGYVLAMSRSRFDAVATQDGVGIWQLPLGVVRSQGYLGQTENAAKLKVPEVSAQIAASYTKQLLSAFDAEDFMYAIACFGMSLQEAGRLQARLVSAAPDAKSRRDIMKIIRAGVLTSKQVDNIARFFAAGIVGENPQEFGLVNSQPFSSLY